MRADTAAGQAGQNEGSGGISFRRYFFTGEQST